MSVIDCKTIDDLIDYCLVSYNHKSNEIVYDTAIHFHPLKIITILKSKNNKPSKHDLAIINEINKFKIKNTSNKNIFRAMKEHHQRILELYRNRECNEISRSENSG